MFPCDFARKNNEVDIYGTGGMILQDMKNLLAFLPGLKRLALIDLELYVCLGWICNCKTEEMYSSLLYTSQSKRDATLSSKQSSA